MVNDVGNYVDEKNAYIKREVDDFTKLLDYVKKTIDERPHIIAVNARYSGYLMRDKYQFAFAESAENHGDDCLGFVVHRKGFIRKVNVRLTP